MIVPNTTITGMGFILLSAVVWGSICRPPLKLIRASLLFGLALFVPYFLLVPIIYLERNEVNWLYATIPVWTVFLRGLAGMQITIVTISTLSVSDLRQGLIQLPLPAVIFAGLLQIVRNFYYLTNRQQDWTRWARKNSNACLSISDLRSLSHPMTSILSIASVRE